jgi:hypothetical protein
VQAQQKVQVEAAALEEASRNEARPLVDKQEKHRAANKAWTANMLAEAESKHAAAGAARRYYAFSLQEEAVSKRFVACAGSARSAGGGSRTRGSF